MSPELASQAPWHVAEMEILGEEWFFEGLCDVRVVILEYGGYLVIQERYDEEVVWTQKHGS